MKTASQVQRFELWHTLVTAGCLFFVVQPFYWMAQMWCASLFASEPMPGPGFLSHYMGKQSAPGAFVCITDLLVWLLLLASATYLARELFRQFRLLIHPRK